MSTIERRGFHPNFYPLDPVLGILRHGILIYKDPGLSDYGPGGRIEAGKCGPVSGYLCARSIAADDRLGACIVTPIEADGYRVIVLDRMGLSDDAILAALGVRAEAAPEAMGLRVDLAEASREGLLEAARAAGIKVDGRRSTDAIRAQIEEALGLAGE